MRKTPDGAGRRQGTLGDAKHRAMPRHARQRRATPGVARPRLSPTTPGDAKRRAMRSHAKRRATGDAKHRSTPRDAGRRQATLGDAKHRATPGDAKRRATPGDAKRRATPGDAKRFARLRPALPGFARPRFGRLRFSRFRFGRLRFGRLRFSRLRSASPGWARLLGFARTLDFAWLLGSADFRTTTPSPQSYFQQYLELSVTSFELAVICQVARGQAL